MRHLDETGRERPVHRIALRLAACGQAGDRGAVVVTLTEQDLVLLATVVAVRDLPHHLEDLLIGLRAGVGIVDAGHPRHLLDQPLGEHRSGDRSGRACEIAHLHQLGAHCIGDALPPVADVDRPDPARDGIDMFLAARIPDPHALAFDDDARIDGLERLVLDQVMPQMRPIGLDHRAHVVAKCRVVHANAFQGREGRPRQP